MNNQHEKKKNQTNFISITILHHGHNLRFNVYATNYDENKN